MNHLASVTSLANRYFVIRHGQSESNAQHIIVGDPEVGVTSYGLTELGKQQVIDAFHSQTVLDSRTIIYASDFLRANQTAQQICELLQCHDVRLTKALRERYFGVYEGRPSSEYENIWLADQVDPSGVYNGVESVAEVIDRTSGLIIELEKCYQDQTILLVSHGDTIQMLQSAFQKVIPPAHQQIPHLKNAELLELTLGV